MRLDAPLYSPVVAYPIITAGLAIAVFQLARVIVFLIVESYDLVFVKLLATVYYDPAGASTDRFVVGLSLGIAAAVVWFKGWARRPECAKSETRREDRSRRVD